MKTCPTCQGSGQVPDYIATALNGNHDGQTCHCDGPAHQWKAGWCPAAGPRNPR